MVRQSLAVAVATLVLGGVVSAAEPLKIKKSDPVKAPARAADNGEAPAELIPAGPAHNPEVAWNDHFATHQEPPAVVREAVRKLFDKHKFDDVIAIINAALRTGQGQPWMHEVLGLALQANGRPQAEIERTLLSSIDLQEPSPVNLMYAAKYLASSGSEARALKMFRQASMAVPTRHEPYVHGLDLARRLNDVEATKWAVTGILGQAWPDDKANLWEQASGIGKATIEQLRAKGQNAEADAFQKAIDQALVRDVIVVVRWLGEADVDMVVEEPSGTICTHRNQLTTSGGAILSDAFARQGKTSNKAISETYVCPQGFDGQYRMKLRRVWGNLAASKVTVDIYTHWGTDKTRHMTKQVPLGNEDSVVLFNLDGGRRKEQLAENLVANAVEQQAAVRQNLLIQQLDSMATTAPVTKLLGVRQRQFAGAKAVANNVPGTPGYQPVIIVLSEGAQMSAQAVISADRRYVRFTGVPLFTGIGDVTTFDIGTGSTTRQPFNGAGAGNGQLGNGQDAGN